MKIFAISDIHGDMRYIAPAGDLLRSADVVVIAGDITATGKSEDAERILLELEKYNRNILAVHGNWDRIEVLDFLEEKGYSIHARGRRIGDVGFCGVGGSSRTPMRTATEYSEEDLHEFVELGYNRIKDAPVKILVSHVPPKNARDRTFLGLRGGSTSVRESIEQNGFAFCIAGHIHEAAGTEILLSTVVVNPGPFKKGLYALIETGGSAPVLMGKLKK